MAIYSNDKYLKKSNSNAFDYIYSPGEEVPYSGIYICVNCKKEVACNEGDPLPPQNKHQHNTLNPIGWKLIVATESR